MSITVVRSAPDFDAACTVANSPVKALIQISYLCVGLRRDIDLLHGEVVVGSQLVEVGGALVRTAPKSAAGIRRVTLPPFVAAEVQAHLDRYVDAGSDALLFTGARGGSPSGSKWSSIWTVARRNAGLSDTVHVHVHDLRHAGATLAAQAGATTQELMARLGHGSPRAASSTNTPPTTGTEPSLMACNAWPVPSGPT